MTITDQQVKEVIGKLSMDIQDNKDHENLEYYPAIIKGLKELLDMRIALDAIYQKYDNAKKHEENLKDA